MQDNKVENQKHIFYCSSLNANSVGNVNSTQYKEVFSEDTGSYEKDEQVRIRSGAAQHF